MLSNTRNRPHLPGTFAILRSIFAAIDTRRKLQLFLLALLMIITGLVELISVGAIIPFLTSLSQPLSSGSNIHDLGADIFSLTRNNIIISSLFFTLAVLLSAIIRLATLRCNGLLSAAIGSDLSAQIFKNILYQPYQKFSQYRSSEIIAVLNDYINSTIGAVFALLQALTALVVALFLVAGLFFLDPLFASCTFFLLVVTYFCIAVYTRSRLNENGSKISVFTRDSLKAIQESLGSIKNIILEGSYDQFINQYISIEQRQRVLQVENAFITAFPRLTIECLALVAIALFATLNSFFSNSSELLGTLGVVALGSQRVLPSLQQVFSGWAYVKGTSAKIAKVLSYASLRPNAQCYQYTQKSIPFEQAIVLNNVSYMYPGSSRAILKNVTLSLNKGEIIGLIGATGSGKSTLINIIIGLLPPSSGSIFIDSLDIYDTLLSDEYLNSWRRRIAHVPQDVFLKDDTILANVVSGHSTRTSDVHKAISALRKAHLSHEQDSTNPDLHTRVGENGAALSGGQRQRIGIARAFFKDFSLLVLDESTSALDPRTESEVLQSIYELRGDATVIMIAHHHDSLKECDRIICIDGGSIAFDGAPDAVLPLTSSFDSHST